MCSDGDADVFDFTLPSLITYIVLCAAFVMMSCIVFGLYLLFLLLMITRLHHREKTPQNETLRVDEFALLRTQNVQMANVYSI